MSKRFSTLCLVAALVASITGSGSADMMPGPDFTDTKDYTPGNGRPLQDGFTYEHDIRAYYDIPATYLVDAGSARLKLTFWDSAQNETVVSSAWDGTAWTPFLTIVNLPNGVETIRTSDIEASWVNNSGVLQVRITSTGNAWLRESELTGDVSEVTVVPVPAAALLGILGLSVAGLKFRKFA